MVARMERKSPQLPNAGSPTSNWVWKSTLSGMAITLPSRQHAPRGNIIGVVSTTSISIQELLAQVEQTWHQCAGQAPITAKLVAEMIALGAMSVRMIARKRPSLCWQEVGDGSHQDALCRLISLMAGMATLQRTSTGTTMEQMMVGTRKFATPLANTSKTRTWWLEPLLIMAKTTRVPHPLKNAPRRAHLNLSALLGCGGPAQATAGFPGRQLSPSSRTLIALLVCAAIETKGMRSA